MIVVYDLHWCDGPSLRFLAYLVRRLEGLPVLVLGSVRPSERRGDSALLGEIAGDPVTVSIHPGPLSEQAAIRLVRERLGEEADESFALACHTIAAGNPLLLHELLRTLVAEGVEPSAAQARRSDRGAARVERRHQAVGQRRADSVPGAARPRGCRARLPAGRGCVTCATASRSAHCSMPTAPTAIRLRGSRRCPPTPVTSIRQDVLVSAGRARADGARRPTPGTPFRSRAVSALAGSMQAWFRDRLVRERNASPHTIASYSDTIRLLLTYASQRLGVQPSRLDLGQLDAPLIGAFPDHLKTDRGCSARTRNARLAAIRTFYRYCLVRHPEHAATIERVLQIGAKRHERALVTYLTEPELDALIDAPDRASWTGRRDHAIIILLAQTGLRASELTGLRCGDIQLGTGAHATTTGKGRKQPITPLTKETAAVLRVWLAERCGSPAEPLFPTSTGRPLTRKALARRIAKHATHAAERCPSLIAKTITPHALRHTAAMRLLHAGLDTTVIALWLGHEQSRNHADVLARRPRAQGTSTCPHQAPASPAATAHTTRYSGSWMHCQYVVAVSRGSRSNDPLAGRGLAGASGDEQERHAVMAETCFATNAGVRPSMPTTIAIRPEQRRRASACRRLLPAQSSIRLSEFPNRLNGDHGRRRGRTRGVAPKVLQAATAQRATPGSS